MGTAGRGLVLAGVACAVACSGLVGVVRRAEAVSFGCGPGIVDLSFYPEDTAIVEVVYMASSADPTILGFGATFEGIPEGMFVSLEENTEVRCRETLDPSCPREGTKRWEFPVHFGRLIADVDLTPPPDGRRGLGAGGIWKPGTPITVGVFDTIRMSYETPEIPRSSWTITNTSPYDIEDGVLHVPGLGRTMRYIPGLVIPAGGSLTVEGQMDRCTAWSFGGILGANEPEPVFAFSPAGSVPEGKDFTEVFLPGSAYPTTGREAALAAGAVQEGYVSTFSPSTLSPAEFDLFSFSTGERVGGVQETPIYHNRAWDPVGTPETPSGGEGTWDTAAPVWSDGTSDGAWENAAASDAVFAGAPGEVRLNGQLAARSVTFHTSGYRLSGPGELSIGGLGVHVPAGVEATLDADVVGDGALTKIGEGRLALGGANTCAGGTKLRGGTLVVGSDSQLGGTAGPGAVTIEGGATLELASGFTTGRRIAMGEGGGTIHVPTGTFAIEVADDEAEPGLAGGGKLTKTGPGELNLASGAGSGDLEVVGGSLRVSGERGVYLGSVTIHPGVTYYAGSVNNSFGKLTIDGGRLVFDGNSEPGQPGTTALGCTQLAISDGTIVIGTGDRGGNFSCGNITASPALGTVLITTESSYPENQRMAMRGSTSWITTGDGPSEVDLDIQIGLNAWTLIVGGGVVRFSGRAANHFAFLDRVSTVNSGRLELAKPEGVLALGSVELFGALKLIHSHQIADAATMNLYGGFDVNGCSETLGTLGVSGEGAAIDMGAGASSVLTFADSHEIGGPWYARLSIHNWSGDPAGGGTERIVFGSDADGLRATNLSKIYFVDPAGLGPGTYHGKILPTGELVPDEAPTTYWRGSFGRTDNWQKHGIWTLGFPDEQVEARIGNGGIVYVCSGGVRARNVQVGWHDNGQLDIRRGVVVTGALTVWPTGVVTGAPGAAIELQGDFLNHSTRNEEFDLSEASIRLRGSRPREDPQRLEVAGADLGPDPNAWTDNFALGELMIGEGSCVRLIDEFDNQLDGDGNEALYVHTLDIRGCGWIDLDGLALYYRNGGAPKRLLYADADLDGDVDFLDYIALKRAAGTVGGALWADGDTDGDGDVDRADFLTLRGHFGQLTLPSANVPGEPVPEPTALALIGVGAAVLLRRRRPPR